MKAILVGLCVVVSAGSLSGSCLPADRAKAPAAAETVQKLSAELQSLQGTWKGHMVGEEKSGEVILTVKGNSLHFHRDAGFWYKTTLEVPEGKKPPEFRATIKESPESGSIGEVVRAVFEVKDETLKLGTIGDDEVTTATSLEKSNGRYQFLKAPDVTAPPKDKATGAVQPPPFRVDWLPVPAAR